MISLFVILLVVNSATATANITVSYTIREEMPAGSIVGMLTNHKSVQTLLSRVNYTTKVTNLFSLPKSSQFFAVDETSGLIRTKVQIDRESLCENEVSTCCHLGHKHILPGRAECYVPLHVLVSPLKEFLQVLVSINDINDNVPTFPHSEITAFVSESEQPGQFCIDLPPAIDADSARYAVQDYTIEQPANKIFRLRVNGRPITRYDDLCLLVDEHLDREKISSYSLKVLAVDGGSPPQTGTLLVKVRVLDSNDNRPMFRNDSHVVYVPEDFALNGEIIKLHATDADEGEHGRVIYSFVSTSAQTASSDNQLQQLQNDMALHPVVIDRYGPFFINSETGSITLDNQLDFEDTRFFELRVMARDYGSTVPRFSTTSVMVHVTDVNDSPPEIELYPATLSGVPQESLDVYENEPAGTLIGMIVVTDRDEHLEQRPNCKLSNTHFLLQPLDSVDRFAIVTRHTLDREALEVHHLTLRCEDGGLPSQTVDMTITVNILDRNDNAPRFNSDRAIIRVKENNRIGARLARLNFSDPDGLLGTGDAEFSVSSLDLNVSSNVVMVQNVSGDVIAQVVFDRERRDQYRFQVTVRDSKAPQLESSTLLLIIQVEDENDETPAFEKKQYTFQVAENQPAQLLIGSVRAHDPDASQNGAVQYSLTQPHPAFTLTERGDLIALVSLDRETAFEHRFTVVATDRGVPRLSSTVEVRIEVADLNDNKPSFKWPNSRNNTLSVSAKTLPGPIGIVEAADNDDGKNGRVAYELLHSDNDLLEIHPVTGEIILKRPVAEADQRTITRLLVKASDQGQPGLHETAYVNVHFADQVLIGRASEKPASKDDEWNNVAILIIGGFAVVSAILIAAVIFIGMRRRSHNRFVGLSAQRMESGLSSETASARSSSTRSPIPSVVSNSSLEEVVVQQCTRVRGRDQQQQVDEVTASARLLSNWSPEPSEPNQHTISPSFTITNFRPNVRTSQSRQSLRRDGSLHSRSLLQRRDELGSDNSLSSGRSMSEECLSSKATTSRKAAHGADWHVNDSNAPTSSKKLVRPATYPPFGTKKSEKKVPASADADQRSPQDRKSSEERSRKTPRNSDSSSSRHGNSRSHSYARNQAFRFGSTSSSDSNNSPPPTYSSRPSTSGKARGTFV